METSGIKSKIVEECTLPSKGLIYDDGKVNPDVVLSSMKTKHEMLRLSATDDSNRVMANIIDDCLESDLGVSSYDLCLGDFYFLMMKLRVASFGPNYYMGAACPLCLFEQETEFNLDALEVREYDDDVEKLMDITLPVSENKVKLGFQTPRIIDRINNRCKEYRRKHKDTDDNPIVLYTILASIMEIDGEEPNPFTLENWVKELPIMDTQALINRIEQMNDAIGVDLVEEATCKVCGRHYRVPFRITGEFFRPHNLGLQVKGQSNI